MIVSACTFLLLRTRQTAVLTPVYPKISSNSFLLLTVICELEQEMMSPGIKVVLVRGVGVFLRVRVFEAGIAWSFTSI